MMNQKPLFRNALEQVVKELALRKFPDMKAYIFATGLNESGVYRMLERGSARSESLEQLARPLEIDLSDLQSKVKELEPYYSEYNVQQTGHGNAIGSRGVHTVVGANPEEVKRLKERVEELKEDKQTLQQEKAELLKIINKLSGKD